MIDETDVRFVTSAISSIRKGQLFSRERSFTTLLFCFKIFSPNFIFDINKKECWSGLNTITSCFFYIQQPVKYFPTVSSFWSLIFVNGRLCIFMNLISVAYGRIQYSLTMVQMAQCFQFFIHWQKKGEKLGCWRNLWLIRLGSSPLIALSRSQVSICFTCKATCVSSYFPHFQHCSLWY